MSLQFPIAKLARKHYHWKTLKLSGAFALLRGSTIIESKDYIHALNFVETLDTDLLAFEIELKKEPYEQFVSYMQKRGAKEPYEISIHLLKKLGYISQGGNIDNKIKELHKLASGYDTEGIYQITEVGIKYEKLVAVEQLGISYTEIDTSKLHEAIESVKAKIATRKDVTKAKEDIAKALGTFSYTEVQFEDFTELLNEDYAFSPFYFKEGKRGKDYIEGGCGFVVLDVDDSTITDTECHLMLEEYNHHITRTSDYENPFKFRILLELDKLVDIPNQQWHKFLEAIGKDLGLKVDILPKSQIFYSYSHGDREVLSQLEGIPLNSLKYIKESVEVVVPKTITKTQQVQLLQQKMDTFDFAFEANNGSGSVSLIRAARYAKDLGADKEYITNLIWEINEYWTVPMPEQRIEDTILSQINRWEF
jgi:hypothetical protein